MYAMNLFKLLPGFHIFHKDVMDSSTPGWIYLVLTWGKNYLKDIYVKGEIDYRKYFRLLDGYI